MPKLCHTVFHTVIMNKEKIYLKRKKTTQSVAELLNFQEIEEIIEKLSQYSVFLRIALISFGIHPYIFSHLNHKGLKNI